MSEPDPSRPPRPRPRLDPRLYQIAVLAALLVYGVAALDFEVDLRTAAVIVATALVVQGLGGRLAGLPRFDPKSALISALSLCLLLRTGSAALAAAAAAVAIGGKFLIRVRGKHVFNPSNLGLVALMLVSDRVWASPGQWGSAALAAFAVACLGSLVVRRAARSDVTWAFLAFWVAIVAGRALWLGDPAAIPLRQLQSGALLIFAFFMISDPKTTPDSRPGRVLFAALVAAGAAWVQFGLYRPNGLLWALAALSPLVPLIDLALPGGRYRWERPGVGGGAGASRRETPHPARPPALAPDLGPAMPRPAAAPVAGPAARFLRSCSRSGRAPSRPSGRAPSHPPGAAGPLAAIRSRAFFRSALERSQT
jgi:hypothetical protein